MPHHDLALLATQIEQFLRDGFVRIDDAFPRYLAEACRRILWRATGCAEDEPATWTRPAVRVGEILHPLVGEAANTPKIHASSDARIGPGRWVPRVSLAPPASASPSPTTRRLRLSLAPQRKRQVTNCEPHTCRARRRNGKGSEDRPKSAESALDPDVAGHAGGPGAS